MLDRIEMSRSSNISSSCDILESAKNNLAIEKLYYSTLSQAEGEGLLTRIWKGFKSFFFTLFTCFNPKGKQLTKLTELKGSAETALVRFQELKVEHKKSRDGLVIAWKDEFDNFPKEIRERLIKEDMKTHAIGKGLEGEGVDKYVLDKYDIPIHRELSLKFVRNLEVVETIDPIKDSEMPVLLQRVIDGLKTEIESFKE